jgi:hypothetical protein
MIEVKRDANGRFVCMWSGRPLGAVCPCGHRATIPLRLLNVHEGDMSRVYDRPIVCSKRGGRTMTLFVFISPEDMDVFRADFPPSPPLPLIRHSNG